MTNINYKELKTALIKSCRQKHPKTIEFFVDYDKLLELTSSMGIKPIKISLAGRYVKPEEIPFISEYFEKSHLSWFDEEKQITVITFIDNESIDEDAQWLLDLIATPQTEEPDDDKVNDLAKLIANYPCYFATIVSYSSNDPKRQDRPSYEIVCRANKVVIRNSNYQYDPKDFS